MSYISDAVQGVCSAIGRCFGAYDDRRTVSTSITHPMIDVAVVGFSITARDIEVYGSLSIVVDVTDWFGICFVSDFSPASKRWLEQGPAGICASEFVRELTAACASVPEITAVCPSRSSNGRGFRFDMEAR